MLCALGPHIYAIAAAGSAYDNTNPRTLADNITKDASLDAKVCPPSPPLTHSYIHTYMRHPGQAAHQPRPPGLGQRPPDAGALCRLRRRCQPGGRRSADPQRPVVGVRGVARRLQRLLRRIGPVVRQEGGPGALRGLAGWHRHDVDPVGQGWAEDGGLVRLLTSVEGEICNVGWECAYNVHGWKGGARPL